MPKRMHGLGVGDVEMKNAALLFKWWWRYLVEKDTLWKQVVSSCNNMAVDRPIDDQNLAKGSSPWLTICDLPNKNPTLRDSIYNGIRFLAGNNLRINFWEDLWLGEHWLMVKFPRLYRISLMQNYLISDCGFWDGLLWNWSLMWRREFFAWELDMVQ